MNQFRSRSVEFRVPSRLEWSFAHIDQFLHETEDSYMYYIGYFLVRPVLPQKGTM